MKSKLFLAILTLAGASLASAVPSLLGPVISTDTTLQAGSQWYIDGVTYVAPGATLTIEEGVTVYANDQPGSNATALIVSAGGTINAVGTAENPIVFTSIQAETTPLDHNDVGLWGGIILLGTAKINADAADLSNASDPSIILSNKIEGLDAIGRHGLEPSVELGYLTYGGDDDADSSGGMKYVSIRHTGDSITGADGDEIQGLTLGGVGSGTILENIEIFVSDDDGIEIFGGTVNLRNLVLAYAEDDTLDLDQGYRGMGQNIVILQNAFTDIYATERSGDKGGEWDGADSPEDNFPRAGGVFSNMTFVSNGPNSGTALKIRNGGAYQVWNSVFIDYSCWLDLDSNVANNIVEDAVTSGATAFAGNIIAHASSTVLDSTLIKDDFISVDPIAVFSDAALLNNVVTDAGIPVTRESGGKVVLGGPASSSPVLDSANVAALPDNGFFETVNYVGAFDGITNWASWTFAAKNGYLVVPGYIQTDIGLVYSMDGSVDEGDWIYAYDIDAWVYVGSDSDNGSWIFVP